MIDLALYTMAALSGGVVGFCFLRLRPSYWAFKRWQGTLKDRVLLTEEQSADYRCWVELERPISGTDGHPSIYRAIVKDRDQMKERVHEAELRIDAERRAADIMQSDMERAQELVRSKSWKDDYDAPRTWFQQPSNGRWTLM